MGAKEVYSCTVLKKMGKKLAKFQKFLYNLPLKKAYKSIDFMILYHQLLFNIKQAILVQLSKIAHFFRILEHTVWCVCADIEYALPTSQSWVSSPSKNAFRGPQSFSNLNLSLRSWTHKIGNFGDEAFYLLAGVYYANHSTIINNNRGIGLTIRTSITFSS